MPLTTLGLLAVHVFVLLFFPPVPCQAPFPELTYNEILCFHGTGEFEESQYDFLFLQVLCNTFNKKFPQPVKKK